MDKREDYSALYSLNQNCIFLYGEIDTDMAHSINSQLLYLDHQGVDEITIFINSPGGNVKDGLSIYDTMQRCGATITTIATGLAASMGAFLLAGGDKGHRKAQEHATILIHQPLGGVSGQASDIEIAAKNIAFTKRMLNEILSENTGQDIKTIEIDTDRDNSFTPERALEYGLIDQILYGKRKQ